jgi:2-amino-4-hydroxy-6-hydroxymethyldihydropteridine diphosphokinase
MSAPGAVRVLVALGSNLGDRRANLEAALARLSAAPAFRLVSVSPWIESAAEGGPAGQPDYLNGCLEGETTLGPHELLALLQDIEAGLGRRRELEPRHGARTLDLDLLFYGEETIEAERLTVPHPRLEERLFVLEPLCALQPERLLPRSRKTARERLQELRSRSGQR